ALHCFALFVFCGAALFFAHDALASGSIVGEVLELQGAVESRMPGEKARSLRPGVAVRTGTELDLKPESWVVLMMADSTVRKFSGPATIAMTENLDQERGSVLTRLGSALADMLFAQEQEGSEVVMVTREPLKDELFETATTHVPLLVHPARGSSLLKPPRRFQWVNIEGIPLYRVSVYSWDRLLWQGTTSGSGIECPPEQCKFELGGEYHWVVEGLLGSSTVRSEPGRFQILSEGARHELDQVLASPGLSIFSKARLCLSLNLYDKALGLVNSHLGQAPTDAQAYKLRAEILGTMGFFRDAFFDYYEATRKSSGK
ncbi:MAG: hypothetical protein JSV10_04745, partial [Candidatus Zixiibacteriota bacterium]